MTGRDHVCTSTWCARDGLDPGHCLGDVGVVPATVEPGVMHGNSIEVPYVRVDLERDSQLQAHVAVAIGEATGVRLTAGEARKLARYLSQGAGELEAEHRGESFAQREYNADMCHREGFDVGYEAGLKAAEARRAES